MVRHLALERVVPGRVAGLILQQAVALAHGFLVGEHRVGMRRLEAHGDPVEEPPPVRSTFGPKPVHGGHEPEDAQQPPQGDLWGGLAVDQDRA